jgi:hypothetical protein
MASAYVRRVSSRVVDALLADPARVKNVLFPSSTETVIDDEVLITIEPFHALDQALGPAAFIARGGQPLGDIAVGDGPARAFTSQAVRKLAASFALVAPASIATELSDSFDTLREFVMTTAQAEAAMIVYVG